MTISPGRDSPRGSRRRAAGGHAHPARRRRGRRPAAVRWSPWARKLVRAVATQLFRILSRSPTASTDLFFWQQK